METKRRISRIEGKCCCVTRARLRWARRVGKASVVGVPAFLGGRAAGGLNSGATEVLLGPVFRKNRSMLEKRRTMNNLKLTTYMLKNRRTQYRFCITFVSDDYFDFWEPEVHSAVRKCMSLGLAAFKFYNSLSSMIDHVDRPKFIGTNQARCLFCYYGLSLAWQALAVQSSTSLSRMWLGESSQALKLIVHSGR